jgi:hypothetical protein
MGHHSLHGGGEVVVLVEEEEEISVDASQADKD